MRAGMGVMGRMGVMGLMVLMAGGCDRDETPNQRGDRLRSAAIGVLHAEITNSVVGYSRTIRSSIWDEGNNPYLWAAEATVEFVNQVGGIERTDIYLAFSQYDDQVRCARSDAQTYQARLQGRRR